MNTHFYGIELLQGKDGYKVTQDSVLLANFVECNFPLTLIDLGAGSGIIPLIISKRCKGKKLYGIELNREAFEFAKKNVELNGKQEDIEILYGDVKDLKEFFSPDTFDVVVTNPPYYEEREGFVSPHPGKKMAKTQTKLDLSMLFKVAFYLLKEKGSFYFIYPSKKLQTVFLLARRFQFVPKKIRFIHYNIDKNSDLFLIKMGKRVKEGLVVEPPVIIDKIEERKNL